MRLLGVVVCALALGACGKKQDGAGPSRVAREGCEWTRFEASGPGVTLLVESCGGVAPVAEQGGAIVLNGAPVVEVFTKRAVQPVEAAIREQVLSTAADRERLGCVLRPGHAFQAEGVVVLEMVAGPQDPTVECPRRDGFFVSQPEVSRTRFAFVRAAEGVDERSVRFVPDEVADAGLRQMPVTSLAVAERLAGTVEARIDKLEKKSGQFVRGDANTTWTAFFEGAAPVLIVETMDAGDRGSASVRYFFRDGKLYYCRESSVRPRAGGGHRDASDEVLMALAFDAEGRLLAGRKTVSGKAGQVEDADAQAAVTQAADLYRRAAS